MPERPSAPNSAADVQIEGLVERVVFQNPDNGWTVLRLRGDDGEPATAVGELPGVRAGERLALKGRWRNDPKYGRQLRVVTFLPVEPKSRKGLEIYLGSGVLPGIGPATAAKIVKRFGAETLEILDRDPGRLREIRGIGRVKLGRIEAAWDQQKASREGLIFLQERGLSAALAARIVRKYGDRTIAIAKNEPYRLADDFRGIGFQQADRFARELGFGVEDAGRIRAGLVYSLTAAASSGHTFQPLADLQRETASLLGLDSDLLAPGLELARRSGTVTIGERGGEETVALSALARAERALARRTAAIASTPAEAVVDDLDAALAWWRKKRGGLELASAQRQAVGAALSRKVVVLTGGPGTGKTTLLGAVLDILRAKKRQVALAAPTGRAANRLSETTGTEVKTVHRLLEFDPRALAFRRNRQRPLEADVVVVDEASMLDVQLSQALLEAVPDSARLLLVGDADQLPSVGPGKVLDDLIASDTVAVVRLRTIFRQAEASSIVVNAHRIRDGRKPVSEDRPDADFFFIRRDTPEAVLRTLTDLVTKRVPRQFRLDPKRDIQVLTPMRRGELGTGNLNQILQDLLNPEGSPAGPFRIGDRVMQTRNNYDLDVFNGDIGTVAGRGDGGKGVTVSFDGRLLAYAPEAEEQLTLAYATTVHKSQGSEYPCVVVPVHMQHFIMLRRNLLYTAVTRARRLVLLVGQQRALEVAVSNRRRERRLTALADELRAAFGDSPPIPTLAPETTDPARRR